MTPEQSAAYVMASKLYTLKNGDETINNLNDVELADAVMDIVMSNSSSAFEWNGDFTQLICK